MNCKRHEKRNEELKHQRDALKYSLSMKDNKTENTSDAKRGGYLPKSVPDAVAHAQEEFGEYLVFLPRVQTEARKSPFLHPDKALHTLEQLADCARERTEARKRGNRVPGVNEWFQSGLFCSIVIALLLRSFTGSANLKASSPWGQRASTASSAW